MVKADPTSAPLLIVNADDFGLSEKVNAGISHAHQRGIVTSASLMANGRAFEHAVDLAKEMPSLDIGIHLTLVGENPLLPAHEVSSLLSADGALLPHAAGFLTRFCRGKIRLSQVRRELSAQIEKVRATGLRLSHLDSHQHLHVLPGIASIVAELARRYHIPAMRRPVETPLPQEVVRQPLRAVQWGVLKALTAATSSAGVILTPDRFFGFFCGGRLSVVDLESFIQRLRPGEVAEIMCHPGLADVSSPYLNWHYDWVGELDALTSREVVAAVQKRGVRLTGFSALVDRRPRQKDVF